MLKGILNEAASREYTRAEMSRPFGAAQGKLRLDALDARKWNSGAHGLLQHG
jgi:hypothetical protein